MAQKLTNSNFFSQKQPIKSNLLVPVILQNFYKIDRAEPELSDVPFSSLKWTIRPEQLFSAHGVIITFIYLLALYIPQNLKNSYNKSRVVRMCHFWAQNPPFATDFLKKLLISFASTDQPFLLYKILKKFFQRIQSYEDVQFLGQNGPFSQMSIFSENLLISLVSCIHAYLNRQN